MKKYKDINVRAVDLEDLGISIAFLSTQDEQRMAECLKNARLIAAAPELLEALLGLVERGTDSPEHMAAELAIFKATGGQQ